MATTTVNNYIENVRTYFSNFEFLVWEYLVCSAYFSNVSNPFASLLLDILFTFNILVGL